MLQKIKVWLNSQTHSQGRGVGFYAQNLAIALNKLPQIELTNENPDLVHYPFFDLFYPTLPLTKEKPTIVTIHDLTPLVLTRLYPQGLRGRRNLFRQRLSLINVSAILTDSNNSKKDLIQLFKISENKIHVVRLAPDPVFFKTISQSKLKQIKEKYRLPDKFILNVPGGPNPNKNLPALAEAAAKLNLPLVLVGKSLAQKLPPGPVHPELQDLQKLKQFNHLILPGFIPANELPAFYHLATFYCQPSLYEGFGLPLLEAMAAGCLIVSSNTSSLPEICPKGTISFNPNNLSAITKSLRQALLLSSKTKKNLIKQGLKHAATFTWEKTAQKTLAVYQKILT